MKIGFVAEPYETENASGMGYVVLEFMRNLAHQHAKDDSMVVYSSKAVDESVIGNRVKNRIIPKHFVKKLLYFATLHDDVEVLLFMAPMLPLIIPRRIKPIMLCQDIASQKITLKNSEAIFSFFRDHILMPLSLRRAAHIVVPSKATKDDLIKFYSTPPQKISIIFDGYQDLTPYEATKQALDPALKKFFFFTGRVKWRKNVHGIVSAFVAFKKRVPSECKLVIGGGSHGGEYYKKIMEELRLNNLERDVIFIEYVPIEKLYSLYTKSIALVFPSFDEGFGMPIAEAMNLGVPVITSNISSMPEVAGEAGLLVNPYDTEDISLAMERIYSDQVLRASLCLKGKVHARKFSWAQSGEQLLDLLHAL